MFALGVIAAEGRGVKKDQGAASEMFEQAARQGHAEANSLDVDEIALTRLDRGEAYVQACNNCLRCVSVGECLHWLESNSQEESAPEFCPNRGLFIKCRKPEE